MPQNPYTDEGCGRLISRQISWRWGTVDGDHKSPKKLPERWAFCDRREIIHTTPKWVQTGHRLAKQEAKGQKFSMWADSMTTGQQIFQEVINVDPKYCPGAAFESGIKPVKWLHLHPSLITQKLLSDFIWLQTQKKKDTRRHKHSWLTLQWSNSSSAGALFFPISPADRPWRAPSKAPHFNMASSSVSQNDKI